MIYRVKSIYPLQHMRLTGIAAKKNVEFAREDLLFDLRQKHFLASEKQSLLLKHMFPALL